MLPKKKVKKINREILASINMRELLRERIDRKQLYTLLLANDAFRTRVVKTVCMRLK